MANLEPTAADRAMAWQYEQAEYHAKTSSPDHQPGNRVWFGTDVQDAYLAGVCAERDRTACVAEANADGELNADADTVAFRIAAAIRTGGAA